MRSPVATAVAIIVGLIILLGYFLPLPIQGLPELRIVFLNWGVTLAGVAALIGIVNLLSAHFRKLTAPANAGRDVFSLFFLLAFLITLGFGLWLTPGDGNFQKVVTSVQAPIEISLMAVLAISLAYGSLRMLQRRKSWVAVVFVISTLLFLVMNSGVFTSLRTLPGLANILNFIEQLPFAGARGILLGVALGSLLTGIRILTGADRPYSG